MTLKRNNKRKVDSNQNNSNSDTITDLTKLGIDGKDTSSEILSVVIIEDFPCLRQLDPMDFRVEIDNDIDPLRESLTQCQPCECFHFHEDSTDSEDETLTKIRNIYECSSEASSAFVSLMELEEEEGKQMIEAAIINEIRKPNILTLPFKDEYLTVKTIKKKISSKESDSIYSSAMRPKEDIDSRYARPGWITGLHDAIGLGAYEWEKLVKSVLGQGRFGRNSCREPFFRFELPTSLETLKTMTSIVYLERFCHISDRRLALYQKEFIKNREHKGTYVIEANLFKALNNIMVGTLSKEQYLFIYELLEINKNSKIEMQLFSGICALTERLFFSKNLTSSSEESYEIQKGYLETVDFMNINKRLQGVILQSNVDKLIRAI